MGPWGCAVHQGGVWFCAPGASPSLSVSSPPLAVFLDPPSNLTVRLMDAPGQLNVSWQAPSLAFLGTSILYEVKISPEGSPAQVVSQGSLPGSWPWGPGRPFSPPPLWLTSALSLFLQVGIANGRTYCLITNLKGQTRYSLAVRAKPDGVSFNGYWSAWSPAMTVATRSSKFSVGHLGRASPPTERIAHTVGKAEGEGYQPPGGPGDPLGLQLIPRLPGYRGQFSWLDKMAPWGGGLHGILPH